MILLIVDKVCSSIDRIHQELKFYKDVNSEQRYIQLFEKDGDAVYFPISGHERVIVDFENKITHEQVFIAYELAGVLYDPRTTKRLGCMPKPKLVTD